MNTTKKNRILWLINQTFFYDSLLKNLKRCSNIEIFLPKKIPYGEHEPFSGITFDYDDTLTIEAHELEVLNKQNWYQLPTEEAWNIANRHFDLLFCSYFPTQIMAACKHFKGAIILYASGLSGDEAGTMFLDHKMYAGLPEQNTYSEIFSKISIGLELEVAIKKCGRRFWFGAGFQYLKNNESFYLKRRALFLPVSVEKKEKNVWQGNEKRAFFICPRINVSQHYGTIYQKFKKHFQDLNYLIGGAQPVKVHDPNVLGTVSNEHFENCMMQSCVMFYESQNINQIHHYIFDAMSKGVPIVFLKNGMLDQIGNQNFPGQCRNFREAKRKIKRILKGDQRLVKAILFSQNTFLQSMEFKKCGPFWIKGLLVIREVLNEVFEECLQNPMRHKPKRIAVIVPKFYLGGAFRGAKLTAEALLSGSRQCGEKIEVVLATVDSKRYKEEYFLDLPSDIKRRSFYPTILTKNAAKQAMYQAGFSDWTPLFNKYFIFDDGMQTFQDCDLWVIVGDRCDAPPLPIKPMVVLLYDYIQRYVDIGIPKKINEILFYTAKTGNKVFTTTKCTFGDATQYAGLDSNYVHQLPIVIPNFFSNKNYVENKITERGQYFMWSINSSIHKNQLRAVEALKIYYEELNGVFECYITGLSKECFSREREEHLERFNDEINANALLKKNIKFHGYLSETRYIQVLSRAQFLWHTTSIDNGTFSVIEAAYFGIPSLSSSYPAMHEIFSQFDLNLTFMDSSSPSDMAQKLKKMEGWHSQNISLPKPEVLLEKKKLAECVYWEKISLCL